jgi:hypothetical protein
VRLHPREDGEGRQEEAHQGEERPAASLGEYQRARDEHGVVAEERRLRIGVAADEERREKSAADGERRQRLRPLTAGDGNRRRRDRNHQRKGEAAWNEVVVVERGVHRDVLDGDAAPGDDVAVRGIAGRREARPGPRDGHADRAEQRDAQPFGSQSLSIAYFAK